MILLTKMDHHKIGLKCGIEIHQQLEGKKLFCNCPTSIRDDVPQFTLRRKLRAVAGEHGDIDVAARQEQAKGRTFRYQGYTDSTCLVEADEEPPHAVNPEALRTALQFCLLAEAAVSPIIQVMRKTVVDGSNTSGFQRTALVARGGHIETTAGKVQIENISLEEDACRIMEEKTTEKVYRLDRLGIPLIEIGTAPDITSPEQCQEAAKKIGLLLRSLPGVKRGLGTIRQDVNVSIPDGSRIEIKGAQDLRQLPLLVELEVKRQQELLRIKEELRNVRLNELEIIDVTTLLQDSASGIIKKTREKDGKILGMRLHAFSGFLGRELQPNRRLGTECSERAKTFAGVGGMFHSDELPNYGITDKDVKLLRKKLKCEPADAFVLVADTEERAKRALEAVYRRALETLRGVPKEVRKANADGTTSFLRPMPGAARMYPETDVPLVRPSVIDVKIPESLEQKIARYQKELGLSKDLAEFVALSEKMSLFEELVQKYPKMKAAFIAETLVSTPLEIKRNYQLDPERLMDEHFRDVFQYLAEEKIHKDIVLDVLIDMVKGTFDVKRYASLSTEELHQILKEIMTQNTGAPFSALMGQAMKRLAGKASGEVIARELKGMMG